MARAKTACAEFGNPMLGVLAGPEEHQHIYGRVRDSECLSALHP
jgi:hypothetical protein